MIEFLKHSFQAGLLCGLTALSGCVIGAPNGAQEQPTLPEAVQMPPLELHAGDQIPVQLKLGETLIIEMTSNPSTGYRWDATQYTRERRCYLVKEIEFDAPRTPTEGKPLAGAPIKQRWTLRHDPEFPCPAEQRVTWTYRRSWEPFNHSDQQASVLLQGLESAK